jgi:ribonuclease Z
LPPTDPEFIKAYDYALQVQNSSHTPQGAFGYLMSQIDPAPRLTVATHFQAEDDTIFSATQSVRNHVPAGELTFAADFMVLNVSKERILQRRAVVSPYAFYPVSPPLATTNRPKYWKWNDPNIKDFAVPDPTAQIDQAREVPQTDPDTGQVNYRVDGY